MSSSHQIEDSKSPDPDSVRVTESGEEAKEGDSAAEVEVMMEKPELSERKSMNVRRRSWLPWNRQSRRDQQLAQLREGYAELVGLIRNISEHLEHQRGEQGQVAALAEQLPPALESFEKLASAQQQVTAILGRIHNHMENSNEKDQRLFESMQRFDQTVRLVNQTNENSMTALDRVQDRIGKSDSHMKGLFTQSQESNRVMAGMLVRMEKRLFVSNLISVLVVLAAVVVGAIALMKANQPVVLTRPDSVPQAGVVAGSEGGVEEVVAEVGAPEETVADEVDASEPSGESEEVVLKELPEFETQFEDTREELEPKEEEIAPVGILGEEEDDSVSESNEA